MIFKTKFDIGQRVQIPNKREPDRHTPFVVGQIKIETLPGDLVRHLVLIQYRSVAGPVRGTWVAEKFLEDAS